MKALLIALSILLGSALASYTDYQTLTGDTTLETGNNNEATAQETNEDQWN